MKAMIFLFFSVLAGFSACLAQGVTSDSLKNTYVTGAKPTQQNFTDWINSLYIHSDSTDIASHLIKSDSMFIFNTADSNAVVVIDSQNVLFKNTRSFVNVGYNRNLYNTGVNNTFVGAGSGEVNTSGYENTFIGVNTGNFNISGNWNTFVGHRAGEYNTTGLNNTFVGDICGRDNTTGSYNTALGNDCYKGISTGDHNVAVGDRALCFNTSGSYNIGIGFRSGAQNETGNYRLTIGNEAAWSSSADKIIAIGDSALRVCTAENNIALGRLAGMNITTSSKNIAIGDSALYSQISSTSNIAIGMWASKSQTILSNNVAVGIGANYSNTGGHFTTSLGSESNYSLTSGSHNTFLGYRAGYGCLTGSDNVVIGSSAALSALYPSYNVYIGRQCARYDTNGVNNVFIGYQAGYSAKSSGSVFLGYQAGSNETGSNKLYIDNSNTSSPLIYGEFDNDSLVVNGSLNIIQRLYSDSIYTVKSSSWADYVFADDYQLPDISDKIKYVKQHKHLPSLLPANDNYYISFSELEIRVEGLVKEVEELLLIIDDQAKSLKKLDKKVKLLVKK